MDTQTLARLRPASNTSDAIRDALTVLQHERVASVQRANAARQRRTTALFTGSDFEIGEADRTLREVALDAEKLDVMEPALLERLASAGASEVRGLAAVAEANAAAEAAVQAFAAVLPKYARHAEAIAEIARLGEAAGDAVRQAEALAHKNSAPPAQFAIPGAVTGTPTGYAIPLATIVRLPAPDGTGLLFGKWGLEHQPAPAFRYA